MYIISEHYRMSHQHHSHITFRLSVGSQCETLKTPAAPFEGDFKPIRDTGTHPR